MFIKGPQSWCFADSGEPFNPRSFKFSSPQCSQLPFVCIRVPQRLSRNGWTLVELIFCLLQSLLRLITGSAWDGAPSLQSQTQIPSVAGFGRDFNFKCSWCRYYFVLTFFWCGESKAWPFGHRPKPVLQPNGIKHIWWWRFCRKNKEVGTNVPTYVSRLPVPRKIRSLCVLPVAATVDGLMINWYMFQT